MDCLFCGKPGKDYKPESNKAYICGTCVQLLLGADQTKLNRAYTKAIEKGYLPLCVA